MNKLLKIHSYFLYPLLLMFGLVNFACQPVNSNKDFNTNLSSPDKQLQINLNIKYGQLFYEVMTDRGEIIIGPGKLGIDAKKANFAKQLKLVSYNQQESILESMNLIAGKHQNLTAEYNEYHFLFANEKSQKMQLEFRMFNNGFAFRYTFPEQGLKQLNVQQEYSEFFFPQGGMAWLQPYDEASQWAPAYENIYKEYNIGENSPTRNGWCFPALFDSGNRYILISESGPFEPYAAMHLSPTATNGRYAMAWPDSLDANGLYASQPISRLPFSTPWRSVTITKNLDELIQSDMVNLLAPAPKEMATDWIKPGLASWSWLTAHNSPKSFQELKPFIDLSAKMQWPYTLIDANWGEMKDGSVGEVITYANKKNVGVWLWYNSAGGHNIVSEAPRNLLNDAAIRRKEFKKLQEWGVKGIKVDFFQSDKQEIMALHLAILKDAMDHQLLVNFHGCTIPRGWARTYPNLMSMEAVRGEEVYYFGQQFPENAPVANCILPFTRNIVGSMDYTPSVFTNFDHPHLTTQAHELALSVIFESGIQHMGDQPQVYEQLPPSVKELLKGMPSAWDESRLLEGSIGKDLVMARRKGRVWYIAGINGENFPKAVKLNLNTLSAGGTIHLCTDHPSKKGLLTQPVKIARHNMIELDAYGGFIGKIEMPS
ncbi:glycoside hydrolase family 97 protein [Persicobacter psychrovividus]|uniref:Alpha-glucosidase n=1 Tax=Persicobacter psychrovividus TaxID=387638 RepID=A0ABN6LJV8_9BACT|nr:alpha-glucosidase [Persicobacter psychrovividus]